MRSRVSGSEMYVARQYSLAKFLRLASPGRLREYFQRAALPSSSADLGLAASSGATDFHLDGAWIDGRHKGPETILAAMQALDSVLATRIENDLIMVHELACEAGVVALAHEAHAHGVALGDEFARLKNNYDRSLHAFMFHREIFDTAGCFHQMDRLGGWRRRAVGRHLDARSDPDALAALTTALCAIFAREGRGRYCHIDCHVRRDPDRHCYFCYPEDYATTDLAYDESGVFQHRPRRAAFELIFVYRPNDGTLELRAKGTAARVHELMHAFCRTVLGLPGLPDETASGFHLEPLKDRAFRFPTDPLDRVAVVTVRELKLRLPGARSRAVTLSVQGSSGGACASVHDLVDEALNTERVRLEAVRVDHAKLTMLFDSTAGGGSRRRRSLTFDLGLPDRCTLKDDPLDQVARKYLSRWGIARAACA